jgi:hypothetical protein
VGVTSGSAECGASLAGELDGNTAGCAVSCSAECGAGFPGELVGELPGDSVDGCRIWATSSVGMPSCNAKASTSHRQSGLTKQHTAKSSKAKHTNPKHCNACNNKQCHNDTAMPAMTQLCRTTTATANHSSTSRNCMHDKSKHTHNSKQSKC